MFFLALSVSYIDAVTVENNKATARELCVLIPLVIGGRGRAFFLGSGIVFNPERGERGQEDKDMFECVFRCYQSNNGRLREK